LLFQPVLDATGSPQGAVSRMVWNHPVFGQISPGSVRESTDNPELTHRVTMWRLEKALNQARVMRARLGHPFGISVSLPLAWLQEMIARPAAFLDALSNLSVEPGGLVLEIPEDAMLQDSIGLMQIMSLLRSMGIGIALGRFGAGFSSFSFLDRMTLDYLKIDRSFVAQVGRNARETAVCRAIVGVAHELGIRVVADGVKHAGQARQLAQLGCDLLHGDGLAAAMAGPDLAEWVLAHPSVQTARNGELPR
jgi:EAL domain-containing protein (putative c-di-GMP-specific phosphodiesterase class I)